MSGLPFALKIAIVVVLVYAALVAVVFTLQRRMLYFPSMAAPYEMIIQSMGLSSWPVSSDEFRGFVSDEPKQRPKGTVVVFHGNAGSALDRSHYVNALTELGYRVLLAEYPGYGGRGGSPSEAVLVADAKETVELAHAMYGDPIILWGESLGSGVASAVAAETDVPIAGLVLVTPWDSLPKLAQYIYWFFPARWLVLDQYDNAQNVQSFAGSVAVVLAEHDEIIPAAHSKKLYEAIPGSKQLWVLPGAGHNSWPVHPEAVWWREVVEFIERGG